MQNEAGEYVDLYIPRWVITNHYIIEEKSLKCRTSPPLKSWYILIVDEKEHILLLKYEIYVGLKE